MKLSTKIFLIYLAIIAVVLILLLNACSTTKKIKSVTKTEERSSVVSNSDSSVKKTIDSVVVKKDNSVTTIEKSDDYEKETTIEFGKVVINPNDTLFKNHFPDFGNMAADYFPPISRIIIKEKGIKKENIVVIANSQDSTQFAKRETTDLTKSDKSETVKKETVKNKDVKRTSYWGYLWFLLIPAVWLLGWWFGLWPLIPKRKKKEGYNKITYNKK